MQDVLSKNSPAAENIFAGRATAPRARAYRGMGKAAEGL
jgi:hypothetical protein